MTPENWEQVKQLFHAALEREPQNRAAFLDQACAGNPSLRSEVESLLQSYEKTGQFIDAPAFELAANSLAGQGSGMKTPEVLGSYRVLSTLGRGGMGEVYLAEDSRLGRKVALKLLPSSFTNDTERLGRFAREARAASALNHPNILTIYEVGSFDGRQFIASEYVEGETLRQRQIHDRLKLNEVLDVAIQVASALAAAHQANIVHRDIKPENIMVRPDGYVKVVDFGLAKQTGKTKAAADTSLSTMFQVDTDTGVVMGTTAYMSPEQARGLELDARTDIWSLGVVLYEMLSGSMPFKGNTPSDLIVSILDREPPPLKTTPILPSELDWIVKKTLRKDREERYQTARELLGDLRGLKQQLEFAAQKERSAPSAISTPPESETYGERDAVKTDAPLTTDESRIAPTEQVDRVQTGAQRPAFARAGKWRRTALAGGLVILTIGLIVAAYKFWPGKKPLPFASMKITRLTNSGKVIDATLTPDGRYVVYTLSDARKQSIWIRQVTTANDKVVVPPEDVGAFGISISRDGNDLYYVIKRNLDKGTLYRVPIFGGTPVKILEWIDAPVSFSPDGKRMVVIRGNYPNEGESALLIMNVDGSGERILAQRKRPEAFVPIFFTGPSWSPDGELIATSVSKVGAPSQVILFRASDGKEQVLTKFGFPFIGRVEWLPDMSGLLIIAGGGTGDPQVWALSYPNGDARQITNDLNQHRSIGLSNEGDKFVTVVQSGLVNVWVAPEGDAKRAVQLPVGNLGFYGSGGNAVSWTPDGRIVFSSNESGNIDIWIMDADGGNRKQLTSNARRNVGAVVTPDGRYIVFTSGRAGSPAIWRMNIDGSDPKRLTHGTSDGLPSLSPDGKWVVYTSLGATKPTVWRVSIDGGEARELTSKMSTNPLVSPDGKFVAYLYPESHDPFAPTNRIAIIPFEGGDPIKVLEFPAGTRIQTIAQWAPDGKSIFYNHTVNNVTNIWSAPLDGGASKQVTDFKDSLMSGFAWSRDGKTLACTRGNSVRDAILITEVK